MPKARVWKYVSSFNSKAKANSEVRDLRAKGFIASVRKGIIKDTGKSFYQVSAR